MKKKKILSGVAVGAAMAGVMLNGFTGCTNQVQDLYGPPPDPESGISEQLAEKNTTEAGESLDAQPSDPVIEASTEALSLQEGETASFEDAETDEIEDASEEEPSTAVPLYGPPPAVK